MIIRFLISLFIVVITMSSLCAQKEDFQWVFGNRFETFPPIYFGSIVDFNNQPPELYGRRDGPRRFDGSNTAVSGTDGRLLFYTNGVRIFDRRHQIMSNGDSLSPAEVNLDNIAQGEGSEIKQNVVILPWPGRDSIYMLIHHSVPYAYLDENHEFELLYSVVDISKNDEYGIVTKKNNLILIDTMARGRITACRHANGRDWWILVKKWGPYQGYHRFLFDPGGLHHKGIQKIGFDIDDHFRGQAKFSPDGTNYAYMHYIESDEMLYVELYEFDRCEGRLSNPIKLQYSTLYPGLNTETSHGLAFSPNSRYLYATSPLQIHQYDLSNSDIKQSRIVVRKLMNGEKQICQKFYELSILYNGMQLAPNGKIYIAGTSYCYLSEIRFPDHRGEACDVIDKSIKLKTIAHASIPDFPHFRMGPLHGSPCDTLGIERPPVSRFRGERRDSMDPYTLRYTDISWYHPFEWHWSFGDGATDTVQHPDHTYADTGSYKVCLTVINEDGTDIRCDTVHITDAATDVNHPAENPDQLSVYPVPSRDELTIEGLKPGSKLLIFNAQGRRVDQLTTTGFTARYRIDALPPGIYWIRTQDQATKFIRMR